MKKKLLMIIATFGMVMAITVSLTTALLVAESNPVTNLFQPGKITVTLTETKGGSDKQFRVIPGINIEKDPLITVNTSIKAYVFVKVESTLPQDSLIYEVDSAWTKLPDVQDTVYYKVFDKSQTEQTQKFLKNDQVVVDKHISRTVLKDVHEAYLMFTPYAIQYDLGDEKTIQQAYQYALNGE